MHYLRKRGLTQTAIAAQVGRDRHTVARALTQSVDHRYRRRAAPHRWADWEAAVSGWLDAELPIKRMLELARADATTPYTGSAATWYRFVGHRRRARAAAVAPVIRFEGLPGEFLQVDWGEAWVPLGPEVVRRVFLAARLKYSRAVAVQWTRTMTLEPLLRGLLTIAEELGSVPWAWVFDNMKTVTLGRGPDGQPRWNPAFARFATELGFHPELCDPHAPQQKGSVEVVQKELDADDGVLEKERDFHKQIFQARGERLQRLQQRIGQIVVDTVTALEVDEPDTLVS